MCLFSDLVYSLGVLDRYFLNNVFMGDLMCDLICDLIGDVLGDFDW